MPLLVSPAVARAALFAQSPPVLTGDDLRLRPWQAGDAAALRLAYQDSAIQRWHVRTIGTDEEAREVIAQWCRGWSSESAVHWAVVDARNTALLGRVKLSALVLDDGIADVGYWTAPWARGRGACPRAVRAAADWAFTVGFHRLQLEHSVDNPASCRAAEKAGFAPEGTRREAALHADGWHDMHVHARLAV